MTLHSATAEYGIRYGRVIDFATAEYRDIAHGGMKTAQGYRETHGLPGSGLEPECQVSVLMVNRLSHRAVQALMGTSMLPSPTAVAIDHQVVERTRREEKGGSGATASFFVSLHVWY